MFWATPDRYFRAFDDREAVWESTGLNDIRMPFQSAIWWTASSIIAMPVGSPGLQGNAALRAAPELGVLRGAVIIDAVGVAGGCLRMLARSRSCTSSAAANHRAPPDRSRCRAAETRRLPVVSDRNVGEHRDAAPDPAGSGRRPLLTVGRSPDCPARASSQSAISACLAVLWPLTAGVRRAVGSVRRRWPGGFPMRSIGPHRPWPADRFGTCWVQPDLAAVSADRTRRLGVPLAKRFSLQPLGLSAFTLCGPVGSKLELPELVLVCWPRPLGDVGRQSGRTPPRPRVTWRGWPLPSPSGPRRRASDDVSAALALVIGYVAIVGAPGAHRAADAVRRLVLTGAGIAFGVALSAIPMMVRPRTHPASASISTNALLVAASPGAARNGLAGSAARQLLHHPVAKCRGSH